MAGSDSARQLIEALHQAPVKCVLSLTGGGACAAGQILAVPGGSQTILEIVVPYGQDALSDWLGQAPAQFCSVETSLAMARRAYDRAGWLCPGQPVVGLGCTASLATDRPKKGDHRLHVACQQAGSATTYSLVMHKGARSRLEEEELLDAVILNALAQACGIAASVPLPTRPGEELQIEGHVAGGWAEFFAGRRDYLRLGRDGRLGDDRPKALLSGSFNPIHDGHWRLAAAAAGILGTPVDFELSVDNADKPSLSPEEVRRRLAAMAWHGDALLTRAPLFVQKAQLFPGAVFVVGADTAERIVQPRYYRDEADMSEALDFINTHGCGFLVAGRLEAGRFMTLDDLDIPPRFRDLFRGIPADAFRVDCSSTELRARQDEHS
ncbi:MAG: hypothetical protein FJ271_19500 [Planctomycetes bacterium]|nr:hypothetical protein [Planctomycetota bacterium]